MKNFKHLLKGWHISYNPYSDLFQIYDDMVFTLPKDKILEKKSKNFRTIIYRLNSKPVLFEIKKAYDTFGVDIDNLSRTCIIKLIEPYLSKYV